MDFTSPIEALSQRGEHWELRIRVPKEYLPYVVEKGSIGIDGISLTINYIQGETISINIIPHTYKNTNLRSRKKGRSGECGVGHFGQIRGELPKPSAKGRKNRKALEWAMGLRWWPAVSVF